MKVFMTGANGFVGLNIVKALVAEGHEVHAYVRRNSNITFLEPFGVSIHRGELDDEATVIQAMQGCDAVIHTAGNTSCYNRDLPVLSRVNVKGTHTIVNSAVVNRVSRIIYTSTTSTIGTKDSDTEYATESTPLAGFRAKSPYAITKCQAEKIVNSANTKGVESIILNLAEVIGAYDYNLQWGRLILAVYYNQVPFIPPGGGSFCSAAQAGKVHVSALTKGYPGERYIIAGEDCSFSMLINTIAEIMKKTFDKPYSSYEWLYAKALLQEKIPFLFSKKPVVEPYRMKVFAGHYHFDSSKAVRELDYERTNLQEIIEECINWYKKNGFLK